MEFMIALVGGLVLLIPILAVVALIRTSSLRTDLNERYREQQDKIRSLESQVTALRRDLSHLGATPAAAQPPQTEAPAAAAAVPVPPPTDQTRAAHARSRARLGATGTPRSRNPSSRRHHP